MPLTDDQKTRILAVAEQLHELAQAAREGRTAGTSAAPGRSVEHIVSELTFLSTILFAKAESLDSQIPGTTFGELRNDYLFRDGSVEQLMQGFGLDPDKTFPYKDVNTQIVENSKSAINFEVLNGDGVKTIAKSLWEKNFMNGASGGALYGGEACSRGQKLLVEMARVLDEDSSH